jgi:nucleotide-binding universal stress UspA family protein
MFERILVPLDGSELSEAALASAAGLAQRFRSEVILLRAVHSLTELVAQTIPREAMPSAPMTGDLGVEVASGQHEAEEHAAERYFERLSASLRGQGLNVRSEIREGQPASVILDAVDEFKVDLIAMSTHGRGGLGRLINGSVADEIMRRTRVPLLLVRPKQG